MQHLSFFHLRYFYLLLTGEIHKLFSHLKRYKKAKQGERQQRRDERVGETRGRMVTVPISGLEKRVVLLHGSFYQINRPRLSGKKLLKMDLLLLSSPPWHLVKTPLPLSCHWYVPLWAGVSPTLLRVKVSGTWEKAGTLCWSGLRHDSVGFFQKLEERRDHSFQVMFFFIFCFLFSLSLPPYFFLQQAGFKAFIPHQRPSGSISIGCSVIVNPNWTKESGLRMQLTTLFRLLCKCHRNVQHSLTLCLPGNWII